MQQQQQQQQQRGGEAPGSFNCAITGELMTDPVIDTEGHTYERSAIETWLARGNSTSPMTRSPLSAADLVPNRALKEAIDAWRAATATATVPAAAAEATSTPATAVTAVPPAEGGVPAAGFAASAPSSIAGVQLLISASPEGPSPGETAASTAGAHTVLLTVKTPHAGPRPPLDVVCVIDVSGSMGEEATLQTSVGVTEHHGLSLLDVVRHAVRTVARALSPKDRLGIVRYSDTASDVLPLTAMDEPGKRLAERALQQLTPAGATNLWDGLHHAMEALNTSKHGNRECLSAVLLLTDGQPNIVPPRGHLPMLRRYAMQHPGGMPHALCTFGFGYEPDSALLDELSAEGCGAYAFIPDAGFVGTAFVHAVSNLQTCCASNAKLTLTLPAGVRVLREGTHHMAAGNVIDLGLLHFGQSTDVVLHLDLPEDYCGDPYLRATLTWRPVIAGGPTSGDMTIAEEGILRGEDPEVSVQLCRALFSEYVRRAVREARVQGIGEAQKTVRLLSEYIRHSSIVTDPRVAALLEDVEGQVLQAFSREDWYQRWGKHYLPSLVRSHVLQQCSNFKDPGLQHYGGEMFTALRDAADDVFCRLPPPTPTSKPKAEKHASSRALSSMSVYNSSSNPCLAGECLVLMADHSTKRVNQVMRGDLLMGPENHAVKVRCVLKTVQPTGCAPLVALCGGALLVTPWHPVLLPGASAWCFPADVCAPRVVSCSAVFSFVLSAKHEEGAFAAAGGALCASLGHGERRCPVRAHAFWADRVKLEAELRHVDAAGWQRGEVVLRASPELLRRDPTTGIVCGFNTAQH
eukprot:TRINITY_DN2145_c0_g3_i1.p1 TRINITY_DN2145_c0_g3~~TRINITY_DN2145_c0_g3_i1.p1  ORF type:complete len:819 (-),score=149.10 TRINITY_DN2145_c0_g3_i1:60-2471(-)